MTSIPASRRARAMIFAPRSWPSSPGLPIRTRIFPLAMTSLLINAACGRVRSKVYLFRRLLCLHLNGLNQLIKALNVALIDQIEKFRRFDDGEFQKQRVSHFGDFRPSDLGLVDQILDSQLFIADFNAVALQDYGRQKHQVGNNHNKEDQSESS